MDIDRAVRLRELWNNSFCLDLLVEEESRNNFVLCIAKNEVSPASAATLSRLAKCLNLEFRAEYENYTII